MKKQLLGAAVTAVLMSGNALAGFPQPSPADTTIVHLSGASASLEFVTGLFTSSTPSDADKFCDTTKEIWKLNDSIDAKSQNAFYCTFNPNNTALQGNISTPNILVYKRSLGGSAMGVNPLINNDTIGFLNIASSNCTTTGPGTVAPVPAAAAGGAFTVGVAVCNYDKNLAETAQPYKHIPDFGMSDVDPIQFRGQNTPAGFAAITLADMDLLTVSGASAVVFGEPVTLQLFKALQAAQKFEGKIPASCAINDRTEACLPSLNSAQIASLHIGSWYNWNSLKVVDPVTKAATGFYDWVKNNSDASIKALAPFKNSVHVCRRTNGSGTQAQHNLVFLNYPCAGASSATLPAKQPVTPVVEGGTKAIIHELAESGGVTSCLNELDSASDAANAYDNSTWKDGVRWAVGIQALEKANARFEFVKIDGVAPTLAHVVDGTYRDWVENTFQYNTEYFGLLDSDKQNLINAVIQKSGLPEMIADLNTTFVHGFGNGSYLAVPSLFAEEPNGAYNPARPVNPYSRATGTASADNCRVPTIYNRKDASL